VPCRFHRGQKISAKNENENENRKIFNVSSHSFSFFALPFRPPGEAVDGQSGCLAWLRRGGGGAPSHRSRSHAWQPRGHY